MLTSGQSTKEFKRHCHTQHVVKFVIIPMLILCHSMCHTIHLFSVITQPCWHYIPPQYHVHSSCHMHDIKEVKCVLFAKMPPPLPPPNKTNDFNPCQGGFGFLYIQWKIIFRKRGITISQLMSDKDMLIGMFCYLPCREMNVWIKLQERVEEVTTEKERMKRPNDYYVIFI